jgi:hypothetical protein
MALDLYAGPLTRYICGEWENIVARTFREQGKSYQIVRPGGEPPPEPMEPSEVATHISNWATLLSRGLGEHLSSPLAWSDDVTQPYDTDRPHWQGYCALVLTAAHTNQPQHALPNRTPQCWDDHPAFVAATAMNGKSKFTQILLPELWLPADFPFTFQAPGPASDQPMWIGSVPALLAQLETLDAAVFHASPDDLARWRHDGPPADDDLSGCARFGFAIFQHVASFAGRNKLPLKLDY